MAGASFWFYTEIEIQRMIEASNYGSVDKAVPFVGTLVDIFRGNFSSAKRKNILALRRFGIFFSFLSGRLI